MLNLLYIRGILSLVDKLYSDSMLSGSESERKSSRSRIVFEIAFLRYAYRLSVNVCDSIINIKHFIKYAKSYGKEIGLGYDSAATDCWDNPITVTLKNKKSAERDIKSRLDRYKNTEGFEGICVWAHTDGGDKWLLYIGYY